MPDEDITAAEDAVPPAADPALVATPASVEEVEAVSVEGVPETGQTEAGEPPVLTEATESAEVAEPVNVVAPEPAMAEPEATEAIPETETSVLAEAIETSNVPSASVETTADMQPPRADEAPAPASAEPAVKEVIREIEKPLTDADKDQIFREQLKGNL